jgi:hypothetical protein
MSKTIDSARSLTERITQYLCVGGLWNPESMDHDKVRDLLIDCREHLTKVQYEPRKTTTDHVVEPSLSL